MGHRVVVPWAAFTMAYFTFMQQSNLLSPTLGGLGRPAHHPAAGYRPYAVWPANLQQCMGTAEGSPMWLGLGLN